jgi:hypothetical protein
VAGGTVTFAAPTTGASAMLSPESSVPVGANGQASVTAVANAIAGSYVVSATAAGAGQVAFDLTNIAAAALEGAAAQSSPRFAQVSADVIDQALVDLGDEPSTAPVVDAMALDLPIAPSRGSHQVSRTNSR